MLMTQLMMTGNKPEDHSCLTRCRKLIARFFRLDEPPLPVRSTSDMDATAPSPTVIPPLRVITMSPEVLPVVHDFRWRRHYQLLQQPASHLHEQEREARHHAVRGLYAARAGALECAQHHFAQAAACEDIDLCEIPGFWILPRAAMMTAVSAYEDADRMREASALNARIRTLYRPRAVRPVPENVTELSAKNMTLSGNS